MFIKKNGSYVQVVNNGGWHGRVTREGSIDLTAGAAYPIYIVFGEDGGGASMDVWWYGGPQSSWSNSLQNYFYVLDGNANFPKDYGNIFSYNGTTLVWGSGGSSDYSQVVTNHGDNVLLWLDAKNINNNNNSGIGNNANVSTWKDLSGRNNHVSGSAKFKQNGLNNKEALEFYRSWMSSNNFNAGSNQTVFVVFQMPSSHSWGYVVGHGSRDNDWAIRRWGQNTSKFTLDGPTGGHGQLNVNIALNEPNLGIGIVDGNNPWTLRTHTSSHGTQTQTYNHSHYDGVNSNFKMGAIHSGGGDHSDVKISEIIYFSKTLSNNDIIKITYYLSVKWGLTDRVDSDGDGIKDNADSTPIGSLNMGDAPSPNQAPTDIALSSTTVDENKGNNTEVGNLTGSDPDGNISSYELVGGDKTKFNISGTKLRTSETFNYEAKASYSVTVRAKDTEGLYKDKAFTINVNNVNEKPTDIALSSTTVDENKNNNTVVGTLSGTDPDGNISSYQLVGGDQSKFNISGTNLRTSEKFNREAKASYSVTIRVKDAGNLTHDKAFTINVNNVNEAPSVSNVNATTLTRKPVTIGLNATDPDGDNLTYHKVGNPSNGSISISGSNVTYTSNAGFSGNDSFTYKVNDGKLDSGNATVSITVHLDTDQDGIKDTDDSDDDNDGVNDNLDSAPLNPNK